MPPQVAVKLISSLESCFLDEKIENKPEKTHFLMYRNEKLSFQLACVNLKNENPDPPYFYLRITGALADYVKVREMICVPNHYPAAPQKLDDNYMRTEPGLYPNLLRPLRYRGYNYKRYIPIEEGCFRLPQGQLHSLWLDVEIPENIEVPKEETTLTFTVYCREFEMAKAEAHIRVSSLKLPKQKLIHTEWFYCDCIAEAHRAEVFSDRHFALIEKYIKTAVENGINMIMMPVFTQELDTYVGGERLTTQLLGITVEENGKYSFDFTLIDRWIDMCERLGVEYYEIPHFFTQWGADHAPKFMAKVNGEEKRIFGWETDSMSDEYRDFLAALLPALTAHFKKRGIDKRCFFHISDEPKLSQLDKYLACKERIAPYLEGYHIIDALSDFQFYGLGVLKKPIPSIHAIQEFLDHDIEGLWAYYCGAGGKQETTDRYLAMPMARTRILGVQLYLNHIEGFLHWGYNYYHNQYSYDYVDVLSCTDGDYFAPAGDSCLVYPGTDDTVWETMRLNAMREAMDDIRALTLAEEMLGREKTEALVQEGLSEPLTFFRYPKEASYLLDLRERILLAAEESLK
ncbi:MAG: DUF4091 domain-containing protein [Ruminococcaceae bacterium]|nr:DUF4091 domain-containing protein [Oscillospiraceae bacterium]